MSSLGGGVIVGIKSCYKLINRKEFEDENIDCVLAEFVFNSEKIIIGSMYRPPYSDDNWFESMENILNSIDSCHRSYS
jgi:hypothetical protein